MVPTKTCPACSERVRETARKCQFCLHRFDAKPSLWKRLFGKKPPAQIVIAAVAITTLRGH